MKSMILGLVMVCLLTGGAYSGVTVDHSVCDNPRGFKIKLSIEIEFGRVSRDCRGFGICYFKVSLADNVRVGELAVNEAVGNAYFDEDGRFVVEFLKENMRNDTEEMYFDSVFRMEENFDVPDDVLQKLKHEGDYQLKAGNYQIESNDDVHLIRF